MTGKRSSDAEGGGAGASPPDAAAPPEAASPPEAPPLPETAGEASPLAETAVEVRVSYGEVDRMGVAYYGNYMRWFELGRAEYLRARGRTYKAIEADGLFLPVIEAYSRYRLPAEYDDLLEIRTRPESLGQVRIKFAYRVVRPADDALLAEGYTVHACTGKGGRPRRFPEELLALLRSAPAVE